MKVNLGRGFGPLDFDENGRFFSLFPENLPYMDDDFEGDDSDYMVYVDADLVEAVCNAGLDFNQFLAEDVEGRREMLEEAGVDYSQFDLDFDHDVRERLEEEGLLGDYDEDFDDEYDDEYDDDFEDDEDPDEDEFDEEYDGEDFEEDDDFEGDDDYPDDDTDGNSGDTFFGNLR
jgi:segregation and condensation protein B